MVCIILVALYIHIFLIIKSPRNLILHFKIKIRLKLETIIMEDESNNCIFLNDEDSIYKEILTKYKNNI
jgi:hypothetical protein